MASASAVDRRGANTVCEDGVTERAVVEPRRPNQVRSRAMSDAMPGIVRPARRPRGWCAPGPAPASDGGPPPGPGEDLCYLSGDWRILQRVRGHRWSLDDLVTAWAAAEETAATPPARIVDLGCGIGAVLMMVAWRFPAARCVGIEAQAVSVDLARRSL